MGGRQKDKMRERERERDREKLADRQKLQRAVKREAQKFEERRIILLWWTLALIEIREIDR